MSLEIRYKYTKCKLHEQRKTSLIFRRLNILSRISDKSKCDCPVQTFGGSSVFLYFCTRQKRASVLSIGSQKSCQKAVKILLQKCYITDCQNWYRTKIQRYRRDWFTNLSLRWKVSEGLHKGLQFSLQKADNRCKIKVLQRFFFVYSPIVWWHKSTFDNHLSVIFCYT